MKDECESPLELDDEPIEPTRGETVPEEYVWCGKGRGSDGNLSVMYSWRCGEDWAWYDTSGGPRGCTWAIDGRSSFSVLLSNGSWLPSDAAREGPVSPIGR